jgi:hypothetical protein
MHERFGTHWGKLGVKVNETATSKSTFYCKLNGSLVKCPKRIQFCYATDSFDVIVRESDNEHDHSKIRDYGLAPHVKDAIDSMRGKYTPMIILTRLKAYPSITEEELPNIGQIYNYFANNKTKESKTDDEIKNCGQLRAWCQKFKSILPDHDYEKDTKLKLSEEDKFFVAREKIIDDGTTATTVSVFVTTNRLLSVAIDGKFRNFSIFNIILN